MSVALKNYRRVWRMEECSICLLARRGLWEHDGHCAVHMRCLKTWLGKSATCPTCRKNVYESFWQRFLVSPHKRAFLVVAFQVVACVFYVIASLKFKNESTKEEISSFVDFVLMHTCSVICTSYLDEEDLIIKYIFNIGFSILSVIPFIIKDFTHIDNSFVYSMPQTAVSSLSLGMTYYEMVAPASWREQKRVLAPFLILALLIHMVVIHDLIVL